MNPISTARRSVVVLATAAALTAGAFAGTASAAPPSEGRSFPGCPLLLEGRSSGPCVERLQNGLNRVGPYGLAVTGEFDEPTRVAVLDFQGQRRLPADGNVGGRTADALLAEIPPVDDAPPVNSPRPRGDVGGVEPLGRPVLECLGERLADKIPADVLTEIGARRLGVRDAASALSRYVLPLDALKAVKCVLLDRND